ncbi:MAG: hypothetical protein KAH05_03675 [Clostridiales bacterium]|nr:hypothetical protein [Clostridiales bacterium]
MAKFDMLEIKKKLDAEKAHKVVKETIGQKILMIFVTAVALTIFYTFLLTYEFSNVINYSILVIFIVLVILRGVQVFTQKK